MIATPLGCTFGAGGGSGAADLQETEGSTAGSGSSAAGSGATGNPTTAATDSQGGDTTASAQTTEGADSSSGSPALARADLVFVDAEPIDLGTQALAGPEAITLEVTNQGDAAGQILGAQDPPDPLLWSGGTFPGIEGTCGGPLPPGATCTVQLAVGSGHPGLVTGRLEVRYDDFEGNGSAQADITMRASGRGPNLIVNPDAETSNLTGWTVGSGAFETSSEHNHESGGSRSFYGGDAAQSEMSQELQLEDWAESIDTLPMVFHFEGWTRASSDIIDDDPHDIYLVFLDGADAVLDSRQNTNMTHDGWERTAWDVALPVGTRRVRIRLECDRDFGNNCSAWFDDFAGVLAYEP